MSFSEFPKMSMDSNVEIGETKSLGCTFYVERISFLCWFLSIELFVISSYYEKNVTNCRKRKQLRSHCFSKIG